MSVTKAPTRDGSWSGNWVAKVRLGGRLRARTFDTKRAADKWERDQLTARDRGDGLDPDGPKTNFKDYAEAWRKVQPHRDSTKTTVEGHLRNHIYPAFGSRTLGSVRPTEVRAWHAALELSESTKKTVYTYLASVFKAAIADRLIAVSPCNLRLRDKESAPIVPLTVEQVGSIVDLVPDWYRGLFELAPECGLRVSELCGLTEDRVAFLKRELRVDRQLVNTLPTWGPPKSKAGFRIVPLEEETIDRLAAHCGRFKRGPGGLLFASQTGAPLRRTHVSGVMRTAVERAEVAATFHDFRHHYASRLIAAGCNVKVVQRVMGHESATMTLDVYGHLWPDSDDEVRRAIKGTRVEVAS